jgi:HAD superfamily phosphoserine phosphatase-like hydrolase
VRAPVEEAEVAGRTASAAAFFDLDGTLLARPSLERRFFRVLRYRKEIPFESYFLWLREAVRLLPRGILAILQANKMYLRGVQGFLEPGWGDDTLSVWRKVDHLTPAPAPRRRNPRLPVPVFFEEAIKRVAWHRKQGHAIVLLSGTLQPLAEEVARAMEAALAGQGIKSAIRVCATRLEEVDGRWTGRILGEAMFGEAKVRAARGIAAELRLDLAECYGYGDSMSDQWLLVAVGRPVAVNPTKDLARLAWTRRWPVLNWDGKENLTHRRPAESGQAPAAESPGDQE